MTALAHGLPSFLEKRSSCYFDHDRHYYRKAILGEAHRIADLRDGHIEADVISLEDPDRSW